MAVSNDGTGAIKLLKYKKIKPPEMKLFFSGGLES
jgi:hypothetical protein